MRRLLILTTLAVLTISAAGCFHWFNRGSSCGNTYQPAGAYSAEQCAPAVTEGTTVIPGPVYTP
jgi:hypothetical protein